jgi:hypothetical protein
MRLFALLTCDAVTIDQASGKHTVFGHFTSIRSKDFPATHPKLTLFVGLSDIPAGDHTLTLKFGLPGDKLPPLPKKNFWDSPIIPDPMQLMLTQKITSRDANQRLYMISELNDLQFNKAGMHRFDLSIDDQPIGSATLEVG